jgi:vacuolar-type H+-ATPase subunit E/Vma4
MSANEVVEKILADARAEAEKIASDAQSNLDAAQAKLQNKLDNYKKRTAELAEKAAKDKKDHLLASARMQIAKEFLAEKRVILDEVFDKASEDMKNWPDQEYKDLMARLMELVVETGDEQVVLDTNETKLDQQFIRQVNEKLAAKQKGNLTLASERADIGAGFILKRGKIKNNVSLQVMLSQGRKELETELAKGLFEN